jgi:hypothetical protein
VSESPETTPLSAAEEQAIRRNVAEMAKAEWGDNPGTAYHPEEQCKSERQLVRLLEAFDAARATVPAGQDIVAAAQRVVDAKPVRWNDRPADSFIRAVLDLRYALAARPVPAAEPPVAYDEDGDPIRPDPHNEDWYDGAGVSPSTGWKPATAKGTAIGEDEWGRPLHVWTGSPSTGDDHTLHFDPDCEECAYLARPTRETLVPSTGDADLMGGLPPPPVRVLPARAAALGEENDRG